MVFKKRKNDEEPFILDTQEMWRYLQEKLWEMGYVPSADELMDITDIFLDFLEDKGVLSILPEEDE